MPAIKPSDWNKPPSRKSQHNRGEKDSDFSVHSRHVGFLFAGKNVLATAALVSAIVFAPASMALQSKDEPPTHDIPTLVLTQVPVSPANRANRQEPVTATPDRPFGLQPSFLGARVVIVSPDGQTRVLSEGFHSACDPDVSLDGTRVLFAGKKDLNSHWRVYEIAVDGTGLRSVTPDGQEARNPIYLSTLFTLDSPQPWFTIAYVGSENTLNELGLPASSSLYNIKLDGTETRRLTFNPNNNFSPFQMWDGRVVYAAEQHPAEPGEFYGVRLFAIHIEGADVELYAGEHGRRFKDMPCATAKGLVVFVESDKRSPGLAGQLACVHESRPHYTYRKLTDDPGHVYLYPYPLHDNVLLVSRHSTDGKDTTGVFAFDADKLTCWPVFDSPEHDDLQARPVRPRKSPDGHSTVVDTKAKTGVFYGMNSYIANDMMQPHLAPGSIKRVRFIEGVLQAASTSDSPSLHKGILPVPRRLIGEAPVEADGSFNVEVPANTPIILQTLDQHGLALATSGWMWVQPKETRGCIGCHEDPELVPENEYVLALRRPSNKLTLPPEKRRAVVFRTDPARIFMNYCSSADCHGNRNNPLFLPLSSERPSEADLERAYSALMAPEDNQDAGQQSLPLLKRGKYIDQGRARTSWLVWQLLGTNTARPWDNASDKQKRPAKKVTQMPPQGKARALAPEELQTIIQWIDLGAAFAMPGEPPGGKPAVAQEK
ncbi:MAG: hypothetical protein QHJ82_01080 [Verrucomicrobiota bacterium]|nr:hypothetical protein [Verrucomicrobiota bacterium]